MGTADLGSILRVPGRLSFNGNSLNTAWPHGGTGLGLVDQIVLQVNRKVVWIKDEGYGAMVEGLDLGDHLVVLAELRGFDTDAVEKLFPATRTGATSGKKGVFYPGTTFRPGTKLSSAAVKLIFTPDDEFNHRFLVVRNAIPLVRESAELQQELSSELTFPVAFHATIDGTEAYAWELKEDITL